ncbi:MAG: L-seryl-tRNA(Sec) selenium transferase [Lachnospiraceae bacterium]|nr:L-seryl-tRNA(Sec) selenium transferase [Lachnospiraceae bacterium]
MDRNQLFRRIPKVDLLLEKREIKDLIEAYGYSVVMDAIRSETDRLREMIKEARDPGEAEKEIDGLLDAVGGHVKGLYTPNVRRVINGTGTILHTNLGRAPIMREQAERLADIVAGYSNLEYNLKEGRRGERYSHFEELICRITGAEAAMVVNNNAAAVLLILSTLAKGGEAIVSRGELVEIGGKFRVPDVMEQSGAVLVEVGTTNKTHLEDYEDAITENTKVILKVHTSNYRIIGFTQTVTAAELRPLADAHNLPILEDLGSGVLLNLEEFGLTHEPTVQEAVRAGIDVVCFSGDKLLGGPQAGIILGRKEYIARMKKNPLTRAIRVDKFTVTALELVLIEYLAMEKAPDRIPVIRMLREKKESTDARAKVLSGMILEKDVRAKVEIRDTESQLGGGSLPMERIPSTAVVIRPYDISIDMLETRLRGMPLPIVARASEDAFWLDVRTIADEDFPLIAKMIEEVCN